MNSYFHFAAAILLAVLVIMTGCSSEPATTKSPKKDDFSVRSLAKSDIDTVLDIHVREMRSYLRELMIKLYKRNPRELAKSEYRDIQQNVTRLFDDPHEWDFKELGKSRGVEAIYLVFNPVFEGDRVFALIAGLASMIMESYNYNTDFFMLDKVEPQKLYNSARNIEIVVWKLSHDLDAGGKPFLYTNSMPGEKPNLSYERLFGKMIATQDNIAIIVADSTNRVIKKVIQQMATAVFLPI